jgi:hypothetical protein
MWRSPLLELKKPLESGRDTEIDLIEREMEGGVLVVQTPSIHEDLADGGVNESAADSMDREPPTD